MWMNEYLQDILLREGMVDAQRRAALHHLLRGARALPPKPSAWVRVSEWFRHRPRVAPESARLMERPVN